MIADRRPESYNASNMFFKLLVSPVLSRLDSETMHHGAKLALHFAAEKTFGLGKMFLTPFAFQDPRLNVSVAGITFKNPILVGAGWDKSGEAVTGLLEIGFGGVEVGTVTEFSQPGNPKPRQFTINGGIAINRLGFNSKGMRAVAKVLLKYQGRNLPIGISVGKNKDVPDKDAPDAHAHVVHSLYDYGKYFAINVSSPNTPGLRGLQNKKPLTDIVVAVQKEMKKLGGLKPLFVKIAPDMDAKSIDDVIDVVAQTKITGIIATNTTVSEKIKGKYFVHDKRLALYDEKGKQRTWAQEPGGFSGKDEDFKKMSTEVIRYIYRKARSRKLPIIIIGVGGVHDSISALDKIKAGATLVQVVTAIRGEGPGVAGQINKGIVMEMKRLGLTHFEDLVGYDFRK